MTRMEIGIIVIAALIPIISLVILFPLKKKKKRTPSDKKETESQAKPTPVQAEGEDVPQSNGGISTASLDTSDFLDYLKEKSNNIKKPERKEPDFNLGEIDDDLFSDIDFSKRRRSMKNKSISQQIQDLSPELKAMILSGVLDRKDY